MTGFDDAVEVLESDSRAEVVALLRALTDRERKALGPKFRRWLTHGTTSRVTRDRESLAVIATAGGVRRGTSSRHRR